MLDPTVSEGDDSIRVVGRVAAPLRQQTLDILRDAILDFRLRPGQRLVERELIERMGVSRTTVREVLRELAAEGLVMTIPQKGAIVVSTTPEEAAGLYDVRSALESLAARRFVERASDEQLGELRDAVAEFARVVKSGDVRAMLRAKDQFYAVLVAGSGNPAIDAVLSGIQARVRVLRATSLSQPGRPAKALAELRQLLRAIERRDAEGAARAAAQHLDRAASVGLAAVQRGAPAPFADGAAG